MKPQLAIAALLMICSASHAYGSNYCGDLRFHYGPFDYRKRHELTGQLEIVERAHFTSDVEKLIKGSSGYLGGDLNYTLEAWPNHHRALASLARLAVRSKSVTVIGLKYSFECYFNRAVRFQPDDAEVRMLYGSYLFKLGRYDDAISQFNEAIRIVPDSATANYNIGLVYFEKKDYESAESFAKKAYATGFPLQGLKNKLVSIGKWKSDSEK